MHKAIIVLAKADSKESALSKLDDFMPQYRDRVWDWYAIGGRWSQMLAPKYDEFMKQSNEKFDLKYMSDIEKHRDELQVLWREMGMKGLSPYADHYKLPHEGSHYDVVPLSTCVAKVREWQQKPEDGFKEVEEAKERWLDKPKEEGRGPDLNMYGYSLRCASYIFQQEFSFETNVFNIETFNFAIPEDLEGWYAIVIDIHN